ncbi:PspA/IM30 family protein [Candidatus Thiodiazotropha sp. CDECU1]|uniref:PspA/IM30 family protein n=1 Tax=Candidatus Thiodiazotropha sp. CDECU1 TaxID=3065865 RepID=UPI00292FD47A|nr:PspA/IM30 family protein [Candidatus Thiodiazotropha sp. CDECU1]
MALITRVSQLFRADVNAVLDRMEEPEILLKQAVRDMEEALAKDDQRVKVMRLEQKQILSRQSELEQRLDRVTEELDLCFDTGNEALARTLLKRKLESERYLNYLARKQQEFEEAGEALKKRIDENRSRLDSMRQKAELLAGSDKEETEHTSCNEPDFMGQFAVSEDDIELAFLREKQRRTQS